MISQSMQDALNAQVGMEFEASIKYDNMAAYFDAEALPYLAQRFFAQAVEERDHAHKILRYILDAGGRVEIPAIAAPPHGFDTVEDAARAAVDSEIAVTAAINKLMDLALAESDHATAAMLQWFVTEQVEEVATAEQLLRMVQRAGESNIILVEELLANGGQQSQP